MRTSMRVPWVDLPKPDDRVIDGVDQLDWVTGQANSSQREGFVCCSRCAIDHVPRSAST